MGFVWNNMGLFFIINNVSHKLNRKICPFKAHEIFFRSHFSHSSRKNNHVMLGWWTTGYNCRDAMVVNKSEFWLEIFLAFLWHSISRRWIHNKFLPGGDKNGYFFLPLISSFYYIFLSNANQCKHTFLYHSFSKCLFRLKFLLEKLFDNRGCQRFAA